MKAGAEINPTVPVVFCWFSLESTGLLSKPKAVLVELNIMQLFTGTISSPIDLFPGKAES